MKKAKLGMKVRGNALGVRQLGLPRAQVYTVSHVEAKEDISGNSIVSLNPKPDKLLINSISLYWLDVVNQKKSRLPEWW